MDLSWTVHRVSRGIVGAGIRRTILTSVRGLGSDTGSERMLPRHRSSPMIAPAPTVELPLAVGEHGVVVLCAHVSASDIPRVPDVYPCVVPAQVMATLLASVLPVHPVPSQGVLIKCSLSTVRYRPPVVLLPLRWQGCCPPESVLLNMNCPPVLVQREYSESGDCPEIAVILSTCIVDDVIEPVFWHGIGAEPLLLDRQT